MAGGSALDAWNAAFGTGGPDSIRLPITASSTIIQVSTSTLQFFYNLGLTHATYKIVKPTFLSSLWGIGSFFNGQTIRTATFDFTIGAPTGLDVATPLHYHLNNH